MRRLSLLTRHLAGLCLWCSAASASATTLAGVTMPETMTVQGQTLRLNGMGVRSYTVLHVHGYVAGLYVPAQGHDASTLLAAAGPKLLRIQFVHAASLAKVQDDMRDARSRNCSDGCPSQDDAAFAQLLGTARAVQPGDVITYVYGPDQVQVLFNGGDVGTIRNADFSRRMLDGMIGLHPPTAALRVGLLGG